MHDTTLPNPLTNIIADMVGYSSDASAFPRPTKDHVSDSLDDVITNKVSITTTSHKLQLFIEDDTMGNDHWSLL